MDDVSYGALALAISLVAGTATWFAYRKRGLATGLKGAGLTLLPIAAYLTRTLRLVGEIGTAIGNWAVRLVLSPVVWIGVVIGVVAVALFVAGRVLEARGASTPRPARTARAVRAPKRRGNETFTAPGTTSGAQPAVPTRPTSAAPGASSVDDDLADIEALLKSRGIT